MQKYACITLDLEPDHAGRIDPLPLTWKKQQITHLLKLLRKYHVKLTVFVVASMLTKQNDVVELLKCFDAEFHLHSYSHDISNPDSTSEIIQGLQTFHTYFQFYPLGYRAPEGHISNNGLVLLHEHRFVFDASVFPSFWPTIKYIRYPTAPYRDTSGIIEIPHTTISPVRFIFTLSWVKLFGWKFYKLLISRYRLPNLVVFSFHLHDLWLSPRFSLLPIFWKLIYKNNQQNGMQYLESVLSFLSSQEYKFTTIGRVAKSIHMEKTL